MSSARRSPHRRGSINGHRPEHADRGWPSSDIKDEGTSPAPISVVEGVVERMVPGGLSLLRDEEGIVFARGGLAGERVVVEVRQRRGGVRHGVVTEVLRRSPERTVPDCAAHPQCGGCDFLHLSEATQAEAKHQMVVDALRRLGKLTEAQLSRVRPTEAATHFAGARRRARLSVSQDGDIGFHVRGGTEVIPITDCPALTGSLRSVVEDLAETEFLLPGASLQLACDDDGRVSIAVASSSPRRETEAFARRLVDTGIATGSLVLSNRGHVTERFGHPTLHGEVAAGCIGGPYQSDAATFTQATRHGGLAITRLVVEAALGSRHILELFAGAGHLTLPLAALGAQVVAIEGDAEASRWLLRNAEHAPFRERIEAMCHRVGEHTLDALAVEGRHFDVLVADPPRTGIEGLGSILSVFAVPTLVLVSCDLATGSRDLRIALDHGYELSWLAPIDAFPRTSHVEWVARLERLATPVAPTP
ncbi:MAG: class I SAM-dependent RNA methyltransferase [Myxococcota bacterium]